LTGSTVEKYEAQPAQSASYDEEPHLKVESSVEHAQEALALGAKVEYPGVASSQIDSTANKPEQNSTPLKLCEIVGSQSRVKKIKMSFQYISMLSNALEEFASDDESSMSNFR
jgi:hypothetical protein